MELARASDSSARASHTFAPVANWEVLRFRAEMLRRLRLFFESLGFLEVETPLLSHDTVVDRHLDPFSVDVAGGSSGRSTPRRMWLQTSPEFSMKRLMAAGGEAIFQVTRAFRQGEFGPLHNPEFTMVEWYRNGDDLSRGMQLLSHVADCLLCRGAAQVLSYQQVFQQFTGVDPLVSENLNWKSAATQLGLEHPESFSAEDHDLWRDYLFSQRVQPHLGIEQPVILVGFPASQGALARLSPDDSRVAERFELFVDGVELANGYHELRDPLVLQRRIEVANQQRILDGKEALPESSRLLSAMQHGLPPCAGVALGFDRAVMVALGRQSIREIMAFPFDIA